MPCSLMIRTHESVIENVSRLALIQAVACVSRAGRSLQAEALLPVGAIPLPGRVALPAHTQAELVVWSE